MVCSGQHHSKRFRVNFPSIPAGVSCRYFTFFPKTYTLDLFKIFQLSLMIVIVCPRCTLSLSQNQLGETGPAKLDKLLIKCMDRDAFHFQQLNRKTYIFKSVSSVSIMQCILMINVELTYGVKITCRFFRYHKKQHKTLVTVLSIF